MAKGYRDLSAPAVVVVVTGSRWRSWSASCRSA